MIRRILHMIACLAVFTVTAMMTGHGQIPETKLDPALVDPYLGSYGFPDGRLLVIGRTERRLYAYEPGSGRLRGLQRIDDRTWVAGPTLLVFAPEVYRLTFEKDAVRFVSGGTPPALAKRIKVYREEPVTFKNDAVTLSGTLLLPQQVGHTRRSFWPVVPARRTATGISPIFDF